MIRSSHSLHFLHGNHRPRCVAGVDKRFDYYALQFMAGGSVHIDIDGREQTLEGAWIWLAWPGPWIRFHEWPRGRPWDHRYIAFSGVGTAAWESEGLLPKQPVHVVDPAMARALADVWDRLLAATRGVRHAPPRRTANLLEQILLDVADLDDPQNQAPPPWLAAVNARLQDLETADPDYEILAAELAMSLPTLRRRFRDLTGMTLHRMRLESKIGEARRLLGESDTPIKVVAERLHYQDVHYFTRQFTQIVGTSPARYRSTRQA
ncbi:MAG: AraC family transcriptional regulator [Planctomycetota bacterium]